MSQPDRPTDWTPGEGDRVRIGPSFQSPSFRGEVGRIAYIRGALALVELDEECRGYPSLVVPVADLERP